MATPKTSAFAILFHDLLQSLHMAFPDCQATHRLMNQIQANTKLMETIQQDWITYIVPYTLRSFKHVGHYFARIRKEVPSKHVFNMLQLLEKYEAMQNDTYSQSQLCSLLADLETYAFDTQGVVETSSETKTNANETKNTKNRFDDPVLHEMCVAALGDRRLADELRASCSNVPLLNKMYENKTNEQIANQMKTVKLFLPIFLKLLNSKALPLDKIVTMMERNEARVQNGAVEYQERK